MPSRDDLPPRERAVSDTLDELNQRMHSLSASWAYPEEFIEWLEARGYTVVKKPRAADPQRITLNITQDRATLDGAMGDLRQIGRCR